MLGSARAVAAVAMRAHANPRAGCMALARHLASSMRQLLRLRQGASLRTRAQGAWRWRASSPRR
eukprot:1371438-Pyramimonas_sp.AAC.1